MTGKLAFAVLWRLAVVAALAGGIAVLPGLAFESEKRFRVNDADVLIEVQPDGALRITERLNFDFSGSFSGAFRDIPLRDGARITKAGVADPGGPLYEPGGSTILGSIDAPDRFGTEDLRLRTEEGEDVTATRIVWHYRANNAERPFEVAYRVKDATVAYDDVVDVGWVVWGDQWEFWLDDLSAAIVPPDGGEAIEAWVGPASLGTEPTISGGVATMDLKRAPQGDVVEFRTLIPREAFGELTAARIESGPGRGQIEAKQDEAAELSLITRVRNAIFDAADGLAIGLTVLVLALTAVFYVAARERRTDTPRYLPEPPEDIPPALAFAIATEGTYDKRLVVATLLDLADRGYYEATAGSGTDLDLELQVARERPDTEALMPYEQKTLQFFDDLLGKEQVGLSELKDRVPKHSAKWRGKWEELNAHLDRAEDGELEWDRDLNGARGWLAFGAFGAYALIVVAVFTRTGQIGLPVVAAFFGLLFMYLPPATALKRLEPASRERHARWQAFRRWTDDFPSLDDDPPATLKLWRSILVYAVAFGTAEKIARSGRIPDPVVSGADGWTGAAIHHGSVTSSFNVFASGFSGQVAAESSSSSGGGGGGGGSSGGGGGGAW